jgi:hypothetical protein
MVNLIGQYGKGLKVPLYNDVRVKYLKLEVESTLRLLMSTKKNGSKLDVPQILMVGAIENKDRYATS